MTVVTGCIQQQQFMQSQQTAMQQQQEMLLQIADSVHHNSNHASAYPAARGTSSSSDSTISANRREPTESGAAVQGEMAQQTLASVASSNIVSLLVSQIPEFWGSEEENVHLWVQRVNQIARIHHVQDNLILLAASSKLVKDAQRWYDFQTGSTLESWEKFCEQLVKMFDKRVPFHITMQKIEARKWVHAKETFDQYAINKLALLHRLNLPVEDVINLLIGGISITSLSATASTLPTDSIDHFLSKVRIITKGVVRIEKNSTATNQFPVNKDTL